MCITAIVKITHIYWLLRAVARIYQLVGCSGYIRHSYFVLIILKYVKDICTNYNQLSYLISHIRCTKTFGNLQWFICVLFCTSIRQDKEILLDYNYMYITCIARNSGKFGCYGCMVTYMYLYFRNCNFLILYNRCTKKQNKYFN